MAGANPQASAPQPVSGPPPASGPLPQGAQVVEDDKSAFSYQEIANLVLIKNSYPVYQTALEEWDRKEKELRIRVTDRESESFTVKNDILNIGGWFIVFQGVVLTSVSQLAANQTPGKTPLCGKIWSPILITGFVTFVTLFAVVFKFRALRVLELSIQTEKQAQVEAARRGLTLRRKGPEKFRFKTDARNSYKRKRPKTYHSTCILASFSIFFFTAIFFLSYFLILCDFGVIRRWNRS